MRPFTPAQIKLLETFADQAVIAIENTRLFEAEQASKRELQESLEYQTAISDVLKVMSRSTFDTGPVLQVVLDTATRLCRAQMAGLYQLEDGAFRWVAGAGSGALRQHFHLAEPSEPALKKILQNALRRTN